MFPKDIKPKGKDASHPICPSISGKVSGNQARDDDGWFFLTVVSYKSVLGFLGHCWLFRSVSFKMVTLLH